MTIAFHRSRVKTIRQGDSDFTLQDGFVTYPRAMLHIAPECPTDIQNYITWAYDNGYLKCVANVYSVEHLRDVLAEE